MIIRDFFARLMLDKVHVRIKNRYVQKDKVVALDRFFQFHRVFYKRTKVTVEIDGVGKLANQVTAESPAGKD